jgi:triosephosphate isomerase
MEQIHAIMQAADEVDSPVILQASAGARGYADEPFLRHLVEAAIEQYPHIPLCMHQDHGASAAVCQTALRSGISSVMMDGSLMDDAKTPSTFDYNVHVTSQVVEAAHAVGVSVEGELGVLGSLETGQAGEEDGGGMLSDFGCTYVIVGHSERRIQFHETDDTAASRFHSAQTANLTPIFCMGESREERGADWTEYVVGRQLDSLIRRFDVYVLNHAVIAYEPLWAAGTDIAATPAQAQAVHQFIRKRIAKCYKVVAKNVRILYGGSVNPRNAAALFAMPDIDGGLVGRASLSANQFVDICKAANL